MEKPILNDKDQFPNEELIYSHLGKSKKLWISVFEYIHTEYREISEEWRYYNDGKSWLLKVTRKAKTICWTTIIENSFKMTFYFGDKAEDIILNSSISDELKEQFKNGKRYGKIRGITITFYDEKDIENAKSLINIKLSLK
jgi:hypothetical protein